MKWTCDDHTAGEPPLTIDAITPEHAACLVAMSMLNRGLRPPLRVVVTGGELKRIPYDVKLTIHLVSTTDNELRYELVLRAERAAS